MSNETVVRRPAFIGANGFALKLQKITDGSGSGKYRVGLSEMVKGSQNWTNVKFRKSRVLILCRLVELAIACIKSSNTQFPQHFFLEDTGQKRDKSGSFSYGEFRLTLHSRDSADIILDPKSNRPEQFKKLTFNIRAAEYGVGNESADTQRKDLVPSLDDLIGYLKQEYAFYEAGGVADNSAPPPAQSATPFEKSAGGTAFEDDIPF